MNTYDLKGDVAIVTGGAQGIGFAVAKLILDSGGSVALWDRDETLLTQAVTQLAAPDRVLGQVVDIGEIISVSEAFSETISRFQRVSILVNNAAIVGPNMPTWDYPPTAFSDVVHVGLVGTFYCCRVAVPKMIEQNYGRIINVSSIAGKEGNPNAVAYSSAKAGVIALTKSLGKELARYNIAVNAITPGIAKTTMAMSQTPQHIDYVLSKIPRGRMLELSEAASMVCFLATQENSFATGAVFDLSGGRATY